MLNHDVSKHIEEWGSRKIGYSGRVSLAFRVFVYSMTSWSGNKSGRWLVDVLFMFKVHSATKKGINPPKNVPPNNVEHCYRGFLLQFFGGVRHQTRDRSSLNTFFLREGHLSGTRRTMEANSKASNKGRPLYGISLWGLAFGVSQIRGFHFNPLQLGALVQPFFWRGFPY